jgi:hypothetical protein
VNEHSVFIGGILRCGGGESSAQARKALPGEVTAADLSFAIGGTSASTNMVQ